MALTQRLEFRQSQSLVMTPQLMQAIKLLQLSNLDLVAFVERPSLSAIPCSRRANQDGAPTTANPPPATPRPMAGIFLTGSEFSPGTDGERSSDGFEAGAEEWMAPDLGTRAEIEQTLDTGMENVFPEEPRTPLRAMRRMPRRLPTPNGVAAPPTTTTTISKLLLRRRRRWADILPSSWRSHSLIRRTA